MPAFLVVIVLLIVTYSACKKPVTAMTEVYKGRQALMAGNAQTALAHFQSSAELDPNFSYVSTLPQPAITYHRPGSLSARKVFGSTTCARAGHVTIQKRLDSATVPRSCRATLAEKKIYSDFVITAL
jgi:hypothetical protein